MKPMLLAAAALVLPLIACEDDGPSTDGNTIEVPQGDYSRRIAQMEEGPRNATLLRAIRDAGHDCQGVQSSSSQGQVNNAPAWTATCDRGGQWTIIIGRDGVATVASTAELQQAAKTRQ